MQCIAHIRPHTTQKRKRNFMLNYLCWTTKQDSKGSNKFMLLLINKKQCTAPYWYIHSLQQRRYTQQERDQKAFIRLGKNLESAWQESLLVAEPGRATAVRLEPSKTAYQPMGKWDGCYLPPAVLTSCGVAEKLGMLATRSLHSSNMFLEDQHKVLAAVSVPT